MLAFRTATLDDVDAVVALVESAYRGLASREGWTTEADLIEGQRTDAAEITDLVTRPGSVIVLGERPGGSGPVASCHLERRPQTTAYFGMFAVRPSEQGRGIGRRVVAEAARMALGWGCTRMRMTVVRQREDLIGWYERLGFARTGEREPFPYGDDRFGKPVRGDLEFAVLAADLPLPG